MTEKKTLDELTLARPKTAGVPRIGIAPATDQSGHSLPADAMTNRLRAAVNSAGFEALPVTEGAVYDYLLYTEVAQISKSVAGQITGKVSKFAGMLSRSKPGSGTADGSEATVNFKLVRSGETAPAMEATASGKNGIALNLRTALQIASLLTPMGVIARKYGADPAMNGMALLARAASAASSQTSQTPAAASPEMAAVSAALESEAHMLAATLKPKM